MPGGGPPGPPPGPPGFPGGPPGFPGGPPGFPGGPPPPGPCPLPGPLHTCIGGHGAGFACAILTPNPIIAALTPVVSAVAATNVFLLISTQLLRWKVPSRGISPAYPQTVTRKDRAFLLRQRQLPLALPRTVCLRSAP
ncbi:hypothetical protein C1S79_26635 [Mycolicibacterium phocaicum]|uniref:Uncharacterized protein n=1 Tax=Mycolicibacterium phocaicum TaxID=319706 RepID=A0AA94R7G0_9MYCO|nr:hypothetical protein C1S79_26635 [Mycolicibacterium phocaicum]